MPAYIPRVPDACPTPIDASPRYCAVYGHPVQHSASPALQNAGIAALGLNWRYLAFEVLPAELRPAIAGAQAMRYLGLNLTVPHKLLAVDMVDVLDDSAKTWGAVNTVRFEALDAAGNWMPLSQVSGEWTHIRSQGFNTDADAITRSLCDDLDVKLHGARVLLLGAGGAGRVAALKLASDGVATMSLVNRTQAKAEAIAAEIRQRFPRCRVSIGYPAEPVDLLLNATSLGLYANDVSPLDGAQFDLRRAGAVYDMVYRPAETPLLRAAKAAGCRTANGLGMLLYQGARALEIWSGQAAPLEVMRRALREHVYGH